MIELRSKRVLSIIKVLGGFEYWLVIGFIGFSSVIGIVRDMVYGILQVSGGFLYDVILPKVLKMLSDALF